MAGFWVLEFLIKSGQYILRSFRHVLRVWRSEGIAWDHAKSAYLEHLFKYICHNHDE